MMLDSPLQMIFYWFSGLRGNKDLSDNFLFYSIIDRIKQSFHDDDSLRFDLFYDCECEIQQMLKSICSWKILKFWYTTRQIHGLVEEKFVLLFSHKDSILGWLINGGSQSIRQTKLQTCIGSSGGGEIAKVASEKNDSFLMGIGIVDGSQNKRERS